uniref:Serpin domain-containing protein n=1 Tax=Timema douglasi TaxID=61478 RepID=A0A7R8VBS6_TIMDO|nr:unnamed protein product [Timema douglasi]
MGLILLTLLVTSHGLPRRSRSLTDFVGEGTNELAIAVLQLFPMMTILLGYCADCRTVRRPCCFHAFLNVNYTTRPAQTPGYVDSETNLAFSPLGYSALLAILAEGAKGETRNQLVNALHLPQEDQVTRNTYKNVLSRLQTKNELNAPEFRNWFYVYKNFSVEQSYKDILLHNYLTEVKNIEHVSYEDQIRDVTKPNKELEALMEMDKDSIRSPDKEVAMPEMTKEKQEIMAIKAEVQKIEEQIKPDASMELMITNETSDHIKNESMKTDEGKREEGPVKEGVMKEGIMQEEMMKGEGMKAGTIQDDTIKEKLAPEKNELLTVGSDMQAGAMMEQSMMHDALKEGEMIQEAMRMEAQMGSMHEIIKEQIPAMSEMVKGGSEMSNTENEKIGAEMSNMGQEKIEPEMIGMEKETIEPEMSNMEKEKIKPEMINMEKETIEPEMSIMGQEKIEPEMIGMGQEKIEPEMIGMGQEKIEPEMIGMQKEKIDPEMSNMEKEKIEPEMSNMEKENSEITTIVDMQKPQAGSVMMQVADKEMDKPLESEMDKNKLGMEKLDKEMLKRIKRVAEFLRGDRGLLQDPDVTSGLSGNNIVKKSSEKPDSIMVVFNALYYRGSWATPFSGQRADLPDHFYTSDTEKITVPTMHVQDTFNIGLIPDLDSVAIELPYKGGRYSLVVLLPNQRTGLRPLIADHLTADTLKNLDKYMSPKEVRVCLPSFEIGTTTKPIEPLKKFGVVDVFNPDAANLSGISQESGLYVDELVQYVAIRVDKRESSANYLTSSSSIPVESREGDYERFVADHPFLYFVKDHVDDIIVVAGKPAIKPYQPSSRRLLERIVPTSKGRRVSYRQHSESSGVAKLRVLCEILDCILSHFMLSDKTTAGLPWFGSRLTSALRTPPFPPPLHLLKSRDVRRHTQDDEMMSGDVGKARKAVMERVVSRYQANVRVCCYSQTTANVQTCFVPSSTSKTFNIIGHLKDSVHTLGSVRVAAPPGAEHTGSAIVSLTPQEDWVESQTLRGILVSLWTLILCYGVTLAAFDNKRLADSANKFSVELLKAVCSQNRDGNVIISPVSVSTLLALLDQGSHDTTRQQLESVLNLSTEEARQGYGGLVHSLKSRAPNASLPVLEVANHLFVARGWSVRPEFRHTASRDFLSGVEEVTFGSGSGAVAINSWATAATHGRIGAIVPPEFREEKNPLRRSFLPYVWLCIRLPLRLKRVLQRPMSVSTCPEGLPHDTVMVLANAIFFKGLWLKPFKKAFTTEHIFSPQPGVMMSVPFMEQEGDFVFGDDPNLGAKWIELPFNSAVNCRSAPKKQRGYYNTEQLNTVQLTLNSGQTSVSTGSTPSYSLSDNFDRGEEFSMVVVLPNERHGLNKLIDRLTATDLSNMASTRTNKRVRLFLPRFKLNSQSQLIPVLQQLGVTDIFNASSKLAGITTSTEPLKVSNVFQKAEIEIDEEGGTASAATVVIVNTLSLVIYPEQVMFQADHPFLAVIIDRVNSVPLFIARVADPSTP